MDIKKQIEIIKRGHEELTGNPDPERLSRLDGETR